MPTSEKAVVERDYTPRTRAPFSGFVTLREAQEKDNDDLPYGGS